ncbi:MAG TPA: carboxyl transferase domain-containing protein, partial [Lachnospiraceae bacterium]
NALEGNEISKCDTSLASFQSQEVGTVDFVGTESDILANIRGLVTMLPANNEDDMSFEECTDDLNRVCEGLENCAKDTAIALSLISDNNTYFEVKEAYGKDMITAFIKLNGTTVGAVANRREICDESGNVKETLDGTLSARGAKKAADFVEFCDAFNIPVLTLTNVKGFMATKCAEKALSKAVAKLTYAFANATVPKVNVIVGEAFGSAYVAMNSKSIGADMVYAWPNAKVGMMDAKMAAKIMYPDADADLLKEKAAEYDALQSNITSAAKRGYVDTIIEAEDTRKYVIGAFEMLFTKREGRPVKKHGTV